ncbi:uncharacterized protein LOC127278727 isoform X2 [Leptopilina boulardi]|uniref:uncharacterized protein LOC127278727 isoform X2 n=1 Tax=Leptopilina boulardi TaxID=63433 RepID=UPI0021F58737|nr:uncharacterized protein LOC127278727 isoform X2 [Leptopilina boulardi]
MGVKGKEKKNFDKLTKTLRPQPKSRFLPGQVPDYVEKDDLKLYTEHRVNVTYANPKIDNKPPKFPLDIYYNEKKLLEIAKRFKNLDNENMNLMEKLNIIHRSKPKVECWNNTIATYKDKIKERIEINKDIFYYNKKLLYKIENITSDYSRKNHMIDWKKNKAIIEKMQKYPSPLTNFR